MFIYYVSIFWRIDNLTPPISQDFAHCVPNCAIVILASLPMIESDSSSKSRNSWASPYQFSDAFQRHSFPMINLTFKENRVINGYAANYVSKNINAINFNFHSILWSSVPFQFVQKMFQTYTHIIKCQIQNCKNVL